MQRRPPQPIKAGKLSALRPILHSSACRALVVALIVSRFLPAQNPLQTALALTREGRYTEARKMLETVPEPSGTGPRIAFHRLKAAIASGLGEESVAAEEMRSALRLSPQDPALLLGAAMAEAQAGQLDDALQHARLSGKSATQQVLIGDIEEKRGNFLASVSAYREAVALAPAREECRIALALELIQHQAFSSAIEVLNQSAPLFPKSGRIRTLLGIAHYAYGDSAEAVNALEEAIRVEPDLDASYTCLSRIVLQSAAAPAPSVIDSLCTWNPTVCAALKLRIAHQADNISLENASIAALERAPADDPVAQCELGRAFEWTNRMPEARARMEHCVALDPSPQNHYRLALIYRKLGLTDLARRELDLRSRMLKTMSEETALGLNAIRNLQDSLKSAPATR